MQITEELIQYITNEIIKRLGLTLTPAKPGPCLENHRRDNITPPGKRPVLTESAVMKLCPPSGGEGQKLRLPHGAIVTPLAHDYIRAMKITLIEGDL